MKSDELDGLTDAELSEVFALEVAGWRGERDDHYTLDIYQVNFGNGVFSGRKYASASEALRGEADFATSADAVLPWIEKDGVGFDSCRSHPINRPAYTWVQVSISRPAKNGLDYCSGDGLAPTFARAACIALIRAKRSEKEAGSVEKIR